MDVTMRASPLVLLVLLLLNTEAAAQGSRDRMEVFAGTGLCRVGGDEGSLGSGLCVVGGLGVRLSAKISIETDVIRAEHERNIAGGPLEGSATGWYADVVHHFGDRPTRAFIIGSAGVLRSKTTHTYPFRGQLTTFTSDDSNFSYGVGGGVKIRVKPRFSLRPQFRLVLSEATGILGLAATSVAAAYHW
jgi:opacity protein-like surface antigen